MKTMKTFLTLIVLSSLFGCQENKPDQVLMDAPDRIMRQMAKERDEALLENARLWEENRQLNLKVVDYRGDVIVMEAKVRSAESKIDNAYKMGYAAAQLDMVIGEK